MNPLLFLYLNLVRAPQLNAKRLKKEEDERLAREAADPTLAAAESKATKTKSADGEKPQLTSCKKCEVQVLDAEVSANFGLCDKCASNPWALVTPVVVFQLVGIVVALAVFIYRFLNGLPLV
ncbi:hypothetical protein H257_11056 [Aphanomyces astaci]|uniref:Uncharacterized protein n=1 Tax=Aphanomyces astaci TaxID=112090 RepID=W4G6H6_APHAT|nr:hypothetical protein H257_11056 [Aphanomyces astaci]ETV74538.1 hypothetical protein H257_11056 [Aphanomyces astaci]KAF0747379.1 hypothetical protein AaE_007751 [Aphanomyces astaci]RHY08075.1 hypothetical protein DYB36_001312 [Aphanomyces astaci]RHY27242.1 hypothetical protein DYB25_013225 [Aphanomyces astaci]RHY39602.1 hypothetical protein DYB34_013217 [Aphanomyces astaci]|eukprot:XP_009836196.1 hypothetical protein H257_11056 [Aphanomyces astaci]